ncbi:MAG TPA: DUF3093 domain-containing protein [Propionicimonas sp.]|nr:DUF3093 domain-containing protein [Propionicimonas sp.]HQA76897.1 DUF3093 domain-containing protein [Propionicimonas sp.]HQD97357.1 DUF3093 domain-containing protein [Propionicimonas sp.]
MDYSERLRVPPSWWLVGLFFALSFVTAVGFYAGPWVAVVAGAVTAIAVCVALLWFGRLRVAVDADGLHAGDALLEWPYLGAVTALSAAATRERLGAKADPAAWLAVRGYVPGSVEVEIKDPADPHPYWLVSTREPQKLAAALASRASISPDGEASERG